MAKDGGLLGATMKVKSVYEINQMCVQRDEGRTLGAFGSCD